MRPRERRETGEQDLFRSRLDQIIDRKHALVKLARTIDWGFPEEKFGSVYADGSHVGLNAQSLTQNGESRIQAKGLVFYRFPKESPSKIVVNFAP